MTLHRSWIGYTLLLVSIGLLLSGCWDRTEVNDLAFITAAAIDKKGKGEIELSVQIYSPRPAGGQQGIESGGSSGKDQTFVRSAVGITLIDAMARLQEEVSRKLFWGHTDIYIFGENQARHGIRDFVDFIQRYPQTRERAQVFVSRGHAKELLESVPALERDSAEVLREMAKSRLGMNVTVKDLAEMLSSDDGGAVLPIAESLPPETEGANRKSSPYVSGTAIFKGDKLVGYINDKETRGLLWVRDQIKQAIITIEPKEAKGHISFTMIRSRTEVIPKIRNENWSVTVKITAEVDISQNASKLDLMDSKILGSLETQLEKEIKHRMNQALDKAQHQMKVDVFGIGETFHRRYPREWNAEKGHWSKRFPNVSIRIEPEVKIRRPGQIGTNGNMPESMVKK